MVILKHPNPILRQKAEPVGAIDYGIRLLANGLLSTLYMSSANGVGLAAPQVGHSLRIIALNPSADPTNKEQEVLAINPQLVKRSKKLELKREGCLSLPYVEVPVRRAVWVDVEYLALVGDSVQLMKRRARGFEARIWQHEIDHLDGVLIVDREAR
jgi:peptide deformylase